MARKYSLGIHSKTGHDYSCELVSFVFAEESDLIEVVVDVDYGLVNLKRRVSLMASTELKVDAQGLYDTNGGKTEYNFFKDQFENGPVNLFQIIDRKVMQSRDLGILE